jgi:hypothetical protein
MDKIAPTLTRQLRSHLLLRDLEAGATALREKTVLRLHGRHGTIPIKVSDHPTPAIPPELLDAAASEIGVLSKALRSQTEATKTASEALLKVTRERDQAVEESAMRFARMGYATDQHAKMMVVNSDLVGALQSLVSSALCRELAKGDRLRLTETEAQLRTAVECGRVALAKATGDD